jgi:predicted ATPase/DNA-binding CsgD family transcriptional regulator
MGQVVAFEKPSVSSATAVHHAPLALSSFIGRERDFAQVRELLGRSRSVTLTGPGGVGKTRFALEIANRLSAAYAHGVWFVDLSRLIDAVYLPQTVATALELPEQRGRSARETLIDSIFDQQRLLILDNCEHLIEACAELVANLLRACPNVRVLATSRERLSIDGELIWPVRPLALPGAVESTTDLEQVESVHLFRDREAAVRGDANARREADLLAIAEICQHLDGIPLAIELAAARANVLSPLQIARRLSDRFQLLTAASRGAPPRQQTLWAALDWSRRLLRSRERRLFDRLSAFVGSWSLDAAEAVCADRLLPASEILDLLSGLVDRSLVVAEEQPSGMRYRLLETVRHFAAAHLAPRALADLRRRHALFVLALVESAEPRLVGPEQAEWFRRLEDEHDNLRAAMNWAAEQAEPEIALRMAGAAWRFWWMHGHLSEGAAHLDAALALGQHAANRLRASALVGAGNLARVRGDLAAAEELCIAGVAASRAANLPGEIAQALISLGNVAFDRGDWTSAEAHYQQTLELRRQIADARGAAMALHNMAEVARRRGDHALVEHYAAESLDLFRRVGDTWGIALALSDFASVARARGELWRVPEYYAESLPLLLQLGDQWSIAECLEVLAGLAAELRAFDRSVRLLGAADALRQRIRSTIAEHDRILHDALLAQLRSHLTEAQFVAAWAEGQRLSLPRAVDYAMQPVARPAAGGRTSSSGPLTAREYEVASLVAEGLTNRQIAERLVIAASTAERHVANILDKLDMSSRAQLAVWLVEHQR